MGTFILFVKTSYFIFAPHVKGMRGYELAPLIQNRQSSHVEILVLGNWK